MRIGGCGDWMPFRAARRWPARAAVVYGDHPAPVCRMARLGDDGPQGTSLVRARRTPISRIRARCERRAWHGCGHRAERSFRAWRDAAVSDRKKQPAYQWYPGDARRDTALQSCRLVVRGLWREMLDLM